ncbi:MAG: hypothetical protein ACRDKL_09110 [Solirubrobacteraceae bacterium]
MVARVGVIGAGRVGLVVARGLTATEPGIDGASNPRTARLAGAGVMGAGAIVGSAGRARSGLRDA